MRYVKNNDNKGFFKIIEEKNQYRLVDEYYKRIEKMPQKECVVFNGMNNCHYTDYIDCSDYEVITEKEYNKIKKDYFKYLSNFKDIH